MGGGAPEKSSDEVKEGGSTSSGSNRRAGLRNRRYKCDSEYHVAPKYPWSDISGHPIPPSPLGAPVPEKNSRQPVSDGDGGDG